jgi:leucyl/phenylalanyl-tRNA--protein transferase
MQLPILDPSNPNEDFPSIESALTEPDGLLAAGGCLSPQRIIKAYQLGIFPWFSPGEAILWWSPNPRLVLFPEKLIVSRSLKKTIRKQQFKLTYDQAFPQVMQYCAAPREKESGTWITEDMYFAYTELHKQGVAHSFEAWFDGELVGGLYGIAIGQVFFGESMFHRKTDASKVAFCCLIQQLTLWGYNLIDCQVHSDHLSSLGAEEINRQDFSLLIKRYCPLNVSESAWN